MLIFLSFLTFFSFAQNGALPEKPPIPKNNPQTSEKIDLGRMLYVDPRLSYDGSVSCNSCHNIMNGGSDNRSVSVGVNGHKGGRGAGTVFNSAFYSIQFWDGRAASLEEQAKGPLTNPIEMGNKNHDQVVRRLKKIPGYVSLFKKVFGQKNSLNIDNIVKAIASYERSLITPNSPYDKFMKFPTFDKTKYDKKYKFTEDKGRFDVTKKKSDMHLYRVPTLRNIALTAPYFHNGKVLTLDEAVRVMAKTQVNRDLKDSEVKDLVAFLNSLTGTIPTQIMPILPPTIGGVVVDPK